MCLLFMKGEHNTNMYAEISSRLSTMWISGIQCKLLALEKSARTELSHWPQTSYFIEN